MVDATAKNTVDTFNGMKKAELKTIVPIGWFLNWCGEIISGLLCLSTAALFLNQVAFKI
jgi:hypothetical protein